jgi:nucleoside-diphosphate-sugar epimerase
MKIVVTGALGHIGSRLIRALPSRFPGTDILLVDNLVTQRYCSLFDLPASGRYRFVEVDVLNADLAVLVGPGDVVVHLAAITEAGYSFSNPEEVERVNLTATSRIARQCVDSGASLFHFSSTSVYGPRGPSIGEDCDNSELRPQSPYAATKLKEENFLREEAAKRRLKFSICRFGTICGVSAGMRFHTAVNKFCWQAVTGRPLSIWKTALNQRRPYLDLTQAVESILFVIARNGFDGQVYNVVTQNLTVATIVDMVRRYVPDLSINYVDSPVMNELSYDVLDTKLRAAGFHFQGDIQECIAQTVQLLQGASLGVGNRVDDTA